MPIRIDTEAERLIGLGVISNKRAIVMTQECGTMQTTDMQTHISRITTVEAVAIHTSLELCVLYQRTFLKRGEIAFVDTHLAPHLIAWRNQTVADTVIDTVRADVNRE